MASKIVPKVSAHDLLDAAGLILGRVSDGKEAASSLPNMVARLMQAAETLVKGKGTGKTKKDLVLEAVRDLFGASSVMNEIAPPLIDLFIALNKQDFVITAKKWFPCCS